MYDYKNLNEAFQTYVGETSDSKNIIELYFYTTTYRVIILLNDDYELDLQEGELAKLLGFDKKILSNESKTTLEIACQT